MLPDDILSIIIDNMDFYDLLYFCQVSKQYNILCYCNEYFLNIKSKIAYQPITMDSFNTYYIKDHVLYGLGSNRFGQLGVNNKYRSNKPIKINIKDPLSVVCFCGTVAILTSNGLYMMGSRQTNYDDHLPEQHESIVLTKINIPGKVFYVTNHRGFYIIASSGIYYLNKGWRLDKIDIKLPLYIVDNNIMTTHGLYRFINYYDGIDDIVKINQPHDLKDIVAFSYYYELTIATKHSLLIYNTVPKLKTQYNINNIKDLYIFDDIPYVISTNKYYKIENNCFTYIKCPTIKHIACYDDSIIIYDGKDFYGRNVNPYGKHITNKSNKIKKLKI